MVVLDMPRDAVCVNLKLAEDGDKVGWIFDGHMVGKQWQRLHRPYSLAQVQCIENTWNTVLSDFICAAVKKAHYCDGGVQWGTSCKFWRVGMENWSIMNGYIRCGMMGC